jgi:hypothetical protein
VQVVVFRYIGEQRRVETIDSPVVFEITKDEKLQYEFEHELAPAVQLIVTEPYND